MSVMDEELLTLVEAAKVVPKVDGRRVHVNTLWRWCRKGLRGVRLEHLHIGSRIVTSEEAIRRFLTALTEAEEPIRRRMPLDLPVLRKPRTEKQKQRDIARAERECAAMGI